MSLVLWLSEELVNFSEVMLRDIGLAARCDGMFETRERPYRDRKKSRLLAS